MKLGILVFLMVLGASAAQAGFSVKMVELQSKAHLSRKINSNKSFKFKDLDCKALYGTGYTDYFKKTYESLSLVCQFNSEDAGVILTDKCFVDPSSASEVGINSKSEVTGVILQNAKYMVTTSCSK